MTLEEIEKRFNKVLPVEKWETPTEGALYYEFLSHAKEDVKWLLSEVKRLREGIEQHRDKRLGILKVFKEDESIIKQYLNKNHVFDAELYKLLEED